MIVELELGTELPDGGLAVEVVTRSFTDRQWAEVWLSGRFEGLRVLAITRQPDPDSTKPPHRIEFL